MECIFCGSWFASSNKEDKVCSQCDKAIKKLRLGMAPERLSELAQAEKDGRLVVLPCKMGDTIYQIRKPKHARGVGISPRIVSYVDVRGQDYAVVHQGMEPCLKRDLGKTWFLTSKEAEAALMEERTE